MLRLNIVVVLCLLPFVSCLLTNEMGIQPVNSVRANEIPAEVGVRVANGWLTGLTFFEGDRRTSFVNPAYRENLYYTAYGLGMLAIDEKTGDRDYFTRESFESCLERAYVASTGAAILKFFEVSYGIPTNTSGTISDNNLFLSTWYAGVAGATECRTALIRTGRVFEIGYLRF